MADDEDWLTRAARGMKEGIDAYEGRRPVHPAEGCFAAALPFIIIIALIAMVSGNC